MRAVPARHRTILAGLALLATLIPSPALASPSVSQPAIASVDTVVSAASKLRGDLAALVAGETALDSRLPGLVPGYRAGEIPYFVLLSEPRKAAHRTALESRGLRILREYRAIDAFAVASQPVDVLRAAALPSVALLAPIEVVVALDGPEPYVDQTRSTAFCLIEAPESGQPDSAVWKALWF